MAPLPGQLLSVSVREGERVEPGRCLAVVEAMKMEHRILAASAGVVARVAVAEGEQVTARQLLFSIAVDGAPFAGGEEE